MYAPSGGRQQDQRDRETRMVAIRTAPAGSRRRRGRRAARGRDSAPGCRRCSYAGRTSGPAPKASAKKPAVMAMHPDVPHGSSSCLVTRYAARYEATVRTRGTPYTDSVRVSAGEAAARPPERHGTVAILQAWRRPAGTFELLRASTEYPRPHARLSDRDRRSRGRRGRDVAVARAAGAAHDRLRVLARRGRSLRPSAGSAPGIVAALVSFLTFNFFFLPPYDTFVDRAGGARRRPVRVPRAVGPDLVAVRARGGARGRRRGERARACGCSRNSAATSSSAVRARRRTGSSSPTSWSGSATRPGRCS